MSISPFACRCCGHQVTQSFADLGLTPLANDYLTQQQKSRAQTYYPLHAGVCSNCLLVQIEMQETPDRIFSDYAYFSSYSSSWVEHAKQFAEKIAEERQLNQASLVIEIASNDGYLLQHFKALSIPILGVEPAENVAQKAISEGIPTDVSFFGVQTAKRLLEHGYQADLLIGNNVLAHVPDLDDFVAGFCILLKPEGRISFEFPHLANLMKYNQFDTIYHEHFSYFSLLAIDTLFEKHQLMVVDVEQLPTHGGSLRVQAAHKGTKISPKAQARIDKVKVLEADMKLDQLETYQHFHAKIEKVKYDLLRFLMDAKQNGQKVVAYGAPAKGNTMLNFCGIREDLLPYTVDISPHKQCLYLPGSGIPIHAPDTINQTQPDYVLILPWNLKNEIVASMKTVYDWGGKFVTAIPELTVF